MSTFEKGVRDWDAKRVVMRVLLNAYTDVDMVDSIYPDDSGKADRVKEKFRKWGASTPRSGESKEFWDLLVQNLGCVSGTTGYQLVRVPIREFLDLLPEDDRPIALNALVAEGFSSSGASKKHLPPGVHVRPLDGSFPAGLKDPPKSFRPIMIPTTGRFDTMFDGVRAGRVNEKHYYLTPEAALTWNALVRAESYPTYDQCKSGLRALVESSAWAQLIKERPVTSVVMLCGGGSPSKDMVIVNALLGQTGLTDEILDYVILDVSPWMLFSSSWYLEETLPGIPGGDRIRIIPVCGDVQGMAELDVFSRGTGRTLFAITGGTIGNLSETRFFERLERVARPDDLLIVSADCLVGSAGHAAKLIAKYDHREMQRFIAPAIHALIREYDLEESFSQAFKRVEVSVSEGEEALSDVPGCVAVTLTANVGERQIIIVSSTRYVPEQLVAFAEGMEWEHLDTTPSPLNSSFKQFLFRKKAGK
jgi:hypothetical protein